MRRISTADRAKIVACLSEGMSMRATVRLTGFAKKTVERTLREVGEAVWQFQDDALVNLPCRRIQTDEIWSFVGSKAKNVPEERKGEFGIGDVWTWTAICDETKLVPCWLVADRSSDAARDFMLSLASRMTGRIQLTTDGHGAYLAAVEEAFGSEVDCAQLIRLYGKSEGHNPNERKYSPSECTGAVKQVLQCDPDPKHISTSYVERQNLTMRMSMRRMTRLTSAFSKKVESLEFAVAMYFMHFNFCRKHQSLKGMTPAMAAGLTDHVWSHEEVAALAEPKKPSGSK